MKYMIHHIILILLLSCCSTQLCAQQGTVSSGGDSASTGGSIAFSVGQIDYITASGNAGIFAQGLQHSYEFLTLSGRDSIVIIIGDPISLFPNPTRDKSILRVLTGDPTQMSFVIYDFFGKKVTEQKLKTKETVVSLAGFANSMYFVSVVDNKTGRVIQIIKIIKVP